ncbi:MAG: hypothetical protein NTY19_51555 [Planctomycetota bacterium]|nr:hypothetical protein [Planctomycetota bacterium]
MAFQGKEPFFAFLQSTAAGAVVEESAPAENYILDERVPNSREDDFLGFNGFATVAHDRNSWFKQHVDYAKDRVALPPISGTFTAINQPNWLALSPDWDVVRIETIYGLADRAKRRGSDVDEAEAGELIREMLRTKAAGTAFDPFREARLEKWIRHVNAGSDHRPAFVAPYAEVQDILKQADWANRLRDALGLGHIRLWAGNPMSVVLMQYNLVRVHNAHIGKPAWAASPTVLDDVPGQMPNPCFFPAPKAASEDGCGYTVDLATTGAFFWKEFLHGHIVYTVDDIRRIGEVTTDVLPSRIADARKDHRDLLASDLRHLSDLTTKP